MGVQVCMPTCGERARCMWGDTCTWVCVCVCIDMYVHMSACGVCSVHVWEMHVHVNVCVYGHVCMSACVWGVPGVCGWGCMHVFMCVYVCTHTCEHMCLLGIKSRALLMLGNYSINEQPPQHRNFLCLTVLKSRKIVYILSYC